MPLELENEVNDPDSMPWVEDDEVWLEMNTWKGGNQKKNTNKIKHVLLSYERACQHTTNPQMPYIHGSKMHLEHIIPQNASKNEDFEGTIWVLNGKATDLHKRHLNSLGNQCILSEEDNVEIGNKTPNEKFIKQSPQSNKDVKIFPFHTSPFHSAKSAHLAWAGDKLDEKRGTGYPDPKIMSGKVTRSEYEIISVWQYSPPEMKSHSARVMKKVIQHFQPKD